MFDEYENDTLERLNWYAGYWDSRYKDLKKDGWVKRFECFLCMKDEKVDELENRYESLIDNKDMK